MEGFDNFQGIKSKIDRNASIEEFIKDSQFFEYFYCSALAQRMFKALNLGLKWDSDEIAEELSSVINEYFYQSELHPEMTSSLWRAFKRELYDTLIERVGRYLSDICRIHNPAVSESYTFPELRDALRTFYSNLVRISKILFALDNSKIGSDHATYFADNHHYYYERTLQGFFMNVLNHMVYLLSYHEEFLHDILWYLDFLEEQEMIDPAAYKTLKEYFAGDTGVPVKEEELIPA